MILNKEIFKGCPKAISKYAWNIASNFELNKIPVFAVPNIEQEVVITIDRLSESIVIHASHQRYITKLKKNKWFNVSRVSFNPNTDKILDVTGTLPKNAISIRTSLRNNDLKDWRED